MRRHLLSMKDEDWIILIQKLGPKLYRFFLSLNSKAHAEEQVQEVLTRLVDKFKRPSFGNQLRNVEAFAWGIAINLRHETNRKLRMIETFVEDQAVVLGNRDEDINAMKKAINQLDEPEKTILRCVLADMQISEIGLALNIPDGTIKSHIHRAKQNVRSKLKIWGIL